MNRLVAFLVLVLGVCAVPARAALVYDGYATGPGGFSTPYPAVNPEVYAGFIEFSSGILAMSSDRNTPSHTGESWTMTNYSYAEVQAGAPVRFAPWQYAWAGYIIDNAFAGNYAFQLRSDPSFSLRQLLELYSLWGLEYSSPQVNTDVWFVMALTSCPVGADVYCSNTFNWSQTMAVASGGPGRDEYLIPLASQGLTLASGTVTVGPVVPLPPAFWLLGSGLLGFVGVARKRHGAPH